MENKTLSRMNTEYSKILDRTVRELQERLEAQKSALEKLRSSAGSAAVRPASGPVAEVRQIQQLSASYQNIPVEEAALPASDSLLPGLLALRKTHDVVRETKQALNAAEARLEQLQARVEKERKDLDDANAIAKAIEDRSGALRMNIEAQSQKSRSQVLRETRREIEKSAADYESATTQLATATRSFIDDQLAGMLAAEEMGGPIVGDHIEVDDLAPEASIPTQNRPRKRGTKDSNLRQSRIDDLWGQPPVRRGRQRQDVSDDTQEASAEMQELIGTLLKNAYAETGEVNSYTELARESAASRFLVRSKVAQLHPKDALRLRLINYGRELDE